MIAEIKGISKKIDNKIIIDNITFHLKTHEVVALVGPNGAGKTTLLKIMSSLLKFDSGTIQVCGRNIQKSREKVLTDLSFMQDSSVLYNNLTGFDHLHFIAKINNSKKDIIKEIIKELKIEKYIHKKVGKYSLGMKQHLLLAIALVNKPQVLLLDEPLNGLDPSSSIMLRNIILKLREQGTSILFSSHILGEVDKVADRILFINEGRIISEKNIDDLPSKVYRLKVSEVKRVLKILTPKVRELIELDNNEIQITLSDFELNKIIEYLYNEKIEIYDIEKIENDTESIYHYLYGEKK